MLIFFLSPQQMTVETDAMYSSDSDFTNARTKKQCTNINAQADVFHQYTVAATAMHM
jgi:hypothetical protein